ncbi:hypothetical protein BDN72DRAFT_311436 [Pluteus cervinus]|uniref:Uncharacterized protein n=1 Tax=Pluteus cervinus TaxID=181527 RepID=A0ACD3AD06_9AGAR|nr:hypothetical protein BDN72DRAFT_311436 [Pluteus cervinus]
MDASGHHTTQPAASSSTAGSSTSNATPASTSAAIGALPELNADLVAVLQNYLKSSGSGASDQVLRDVATTLQSSLQGKAGGQWTAQRFLTVSIRVSPFLFSVFFGLVYFVPCVFFDAILRIRKKESSLNHPYIYFVGT